MKITCDLCPHHCVIEEGRTGFCQARCNNGGRIVSENYGWLTAVAVDAIEKKPLKRFFQEAPFFRWAAMAVTSGVHFARTARFQ